MLRRMMKGMEFLARDSPFRDRRDAGRRLAQRLRERAVPVERAVVLALPRGGVPVGYEIALELGAPLDVFTVRKLGVPRHAELAMGAVASGGVSILNVEVIRALHVSRDELVEVARRELAELDRRERLYRDERVQYDVGGRTAIVVDDGLATGSTMLVALAAVRIKKPARLVAAFPTASREAFDAVEREADEVVCCEVPEPFYGVGASYDDFEQVGDDEVRRLLNLAAEREGVD
jgi:putative phosphoribosyl transferase